MLLKKQEITIIGVCSSSVPAMSYYLLRFLILGTSLLPIALCVRFVVLRDAETRRAWQQQQANVNAAAKAAALRVMQEESTRLAGEHKSGRVTSNFYLAKIRDYIFQCLCVKCTSRNCCAIKKKDITIFGVCSSSAPAMLYYLLWFLILQRCSRRKNNISISQG